MFREQIIIEREHILEKINLLNTKIEDILQDKLGTRFDTIYDYAKENPSYDINSELLVLYDFPKGFDEQGLAGLRNILRNGSKCGIYTLIFTPKWQLMSVMNLSKTLRQ